MSRKVHFSVFSTSYFFQQFKISQWKASTCRFYNLFGTCLFLFIMFELLWKFDGRDAICDTVVALSVKIFEDRFTVVVEKMCAFLHVFAQFLFFRKLSNELTAFSLDFDGVVHLIDAITIALFVYADISAVKLKTIVETVFIRTDRPLFRPIHAMFLRKKGSVKLVLQTRSIIFVQTRSEHSLNVL